MVFQVTQILGALLVLAGFAGVQLGVIRPGSPLYLVLNMVGAGILAVLAILDEQWGFSILQGVWAIVSAFGLGQLMLRRPNHA